MKNSAANQRQISTSSIGMFQRMLLLVGILLLWGGVAFAIELDQAKAQGLVGETPSGYLGVVVASPSSEVTALVADINARRKTEYQSIANKNGTSLKAVEALAAKKALQKTPSGQYVQLPSGQWKKK